MKIKLLDTGEIINVTCAQQLANTKVRVTPETSRQIQQEAFKLRFLWPSGRDFDEPRFIDEPFLCFNSNFSLGFWGDEKTFEANEKREFEFLSPTDPETREIVRDIEILEEGEAWVKEQDRINQPELITVERLEKEPGWEKVGATSKLSEFSKGAITVEHITYGDNQVLCNVYLVTKECYLINTRGCSTMQDIRDLDRLVNNSKF
jgi:hypothetical protein